ncbi:MULTISPECIES: segregation and condensation protein A [Helcococcus]|uniref:Segregation and condensation protein A n=1 Tax=Helcococcus bovis TaxID=3153252 RepID=A0ABW9F6A4_9FIRM
MINVSTGEFYGPFDLLLDLIKKSKYDIYEIQISDITNKYIESLKQLDIPADETADFILIATQLLYIKTRSLIKDTAEEEEEDLISQDELVRRLIQYKKIKSIIPFLEKLENQGLRKHYKLQDDFSRFNNETENIIYDINKLKNVLDQLINLFLQVDDFKVDSILNIEEYSLEKYNEDIKLQLIKDKILSISNMLKKVESKSEAIIIFLSILELSKTNDLIIIQDDISMEITVEIKDKQKEE